MNERIRSLLARPIAHRGLHDRSRGVIENTFAAADAAIAAGFGIECDIQLAGDGEAMVFHDETLDRLTAGRGRVDAVSRFDIAALVLTGGADTIPTLPAFLARIAGRVPLVIEIKARQDADMRLAERAVDLVGTYAGPVALKSFDPRVVARCRSIGATCPLGLVGPAETPPESGGEATSNHVAVDFLSWNIRSLAAIRARYPDMPLMTWTVRSLEDQEFATSLGAQIVFEHVMPR